MAGSKSKTAEKSSKSTDKKGKGSGNSGSKDDKASEASSSKLKPATAINARHILVMPLLSLISLAIFDLPHSLL